MNEIHLLGTSPDSVAILFDIYSELYNNPLFLLHPNIDEPVLPNLPNKEVKYKILPPGDVPNNSGHLFFGVANPANKKTVFDYFFARYGISETRFDTIIHPTAYIADSAKIKTGVLIEPNVVVSSQSLIEFGVFIKRGSLVGHHNTIGAFTDINPGVVLSGKVKIGAGCTIGSGTVIKDNITIGNHTTIGIGSVVTKDIPDNCVAFGNPCRVVKTNS